MAITSHERWKEMAEKPPIPSMKRYYESMARGTAPSKPTPSAPSAPISAPSPIRKEAPPPETKTETRYVYVNPQGATITWKEKPANWERLVGKKEVVDISAPSGTPERAIARAAKSFVKEGKEEHVYYKEAVPEPRIISELEPEKKARISVTLPSEKPPEMPMIHRTATVEEVLEPKGLETLAPKEGEPLTEQAAKGLFTGLMAPLIITAQSAEYLRGKRLRERLREKPIETISIGIGKVPSFAVEYGKGIVETGLKYPVYTAAMFIVPIPLGKIVKVPKILKPRISLKALEVGEISPKMIAGKGFVKSEILFETGRVFKKTHIAKIQTVFTQPMRIMTEKGITPKISLAYSQLLIRKATVKRGYVSPKEVGKILEKEGKVKIKTEKPPMPTTKERLEVVGQYLPKKKEIYIHPGLPRTELVAKIKGLPTRETILKHELLHYKFPKFTEKEILALEKVTKKFRIRAVTPKGKPEPAIARTIVRELPPLHGYRRAVGLGKTVLTRTKAETIYAGKFIGKEVKETQIFLGLTKTKKGKYGVEVSLVRRKRPKISEPSGEPVTRVLKTETIKLMDSRMLIEQHLRSIRLPPARSRIPRVHPEILVKPLPLVGLRAIIAEREAVGLKPRLRMGLEEREKVLERLKLREKVLERLKLKVSEIPIQKETTVPIMAEIPIQTQAQKMTPATIQATTTPSLIPPMKIIPPVTPPLPIPITFPLPWLKFPPSELKKRKYKTRWLLHPVPTPEEVMWGKKRRW